MYELISKEIEIEEVMNLVYGISFRGIQINDISPDKEAITQLVKHCNELGLDEIHLENVVIDFVTQNALVS